MLKMLIIDETDTRIMEFGETSELKRNIRKENREKKANKKDRIRYIYKQI